MSKGIGPLQSEILEAIRNRPGGDVVEDWRGHRAERAPGIHDLRAIAPQFTKVGEFQDSSRQDAFRLAIAGLVELGILHMLSKVPIIFCDPDHLWQSRVRDLPEGKIFVTSTRERRFVRLNPPAIPKSFEI